MLNIVTIVLRHQIGFIELLVVLHGVPVGDSTFVFMKRVLTDDDRVATCCNIGYWRFVLRSGPQFHYPIIPLLKDQWSNIFHFHLFLLYNHNCLLNCKLYSHLKTQLHSFVISLIITQFGMDCQVDDMNFTILYYCDDLECLSNQQFHNENNENKLLNAHNYHQCYQYNYSDYEKDSLITLSNVDHANHAKLAIVVCLQFVKSVQRLVELHIGSLDVCDRIKASKRKCECVRFCINVNNNRHIQLTIDITHQRIQIGDCKVNTNLHEAAIFHGHILFNI